MCSSDLSALNREEKRMYRRWKSMVADFKARGASGGSTEQVETLVCRGTEDRSCWREELQKHCCQKNSDPAKAPTCNIIHDIYIILIYV